MASDKQVAYALTLPRKAGFDTRFMSADFKRLGATMRERSGSVEGWLRGKSVADCSALIETLRAMADDK